MSSEEEVIAGMLGALLGAEAEPGGAARPGQGGVSMEDFLGLIAEAVASQGPGYTIPARGSEEYRLAVATVAQLEERKMVLAAIYGLWQDFGWRGPLDLMVEWIIQMETSPYLAGHCRDMFGVVDIADIVVISDDQEHVLRSATDQASEFSERDPAVKPHEALTKALALGEKTARIGLAWLPTLRSAFRAAKQNPADRRAIFAALFHGPGRDDRYTLIQIALTVGTAAMGVRNVAQLAERFHEQGSVAFVDREGAVNPRWRVAYRSRNAD